MTYVKLNAGLTILIKRGRCQCDMEARRRQAADYCSRPHRGRQLRLANFNNHVTFSTHVCGNETDVLLTLTKCFFVQEPNQKPQKHQV